MAIMDPTEAEHFCIGYLGGRTTQESFRNWVKLQANGARFIEGTPRFEEMRDLSLGEVERLLLLSASHYRRVHDGFSEIASAWAYVTLYYGSFFAARALMGMFGVWLVDSKKILAVHLANPGSQEFELKRYRSPTGAGSHAQFWELFYSEMIDLSPYLSNSERFAVSCLTMGFDWQCQERNRINYDSFEAIGLGEDFQTNFTDAGFPTSLPGVLNTQYQYLEAILHVSSSFASQFGLNTDALSNLSGLPDRQARFKQIVIKDKPRSLGTRVKKSLIYG